MTMIFEVRSIYRLPYIMNLLWTYEIFCCLLFLSKTKKGKANDFVDKSVYFSFITFLSVCLLFILNSLI